MEYLEIEESDLEQVIALYESYLNSGSYIREAILEGFFCDDYIGYKAVNQGTMVGFFSGRSDINFTYPHPELEKEILEKVAQRKVITFDALLVLPEYRRMGIATELKKRMYAAMKKKQYCLALMELWIYPDGTVPAKNPLTGMGNTIFQKKIPYFYKENKQYQIHCPICGSDCCCGAWIELLCLEKEEKQEDERKKICQS